jgi:lipopolysaccharide/colanic/teichoic acid biosynthesis glycosyltransferase
VTVAIIGARGQLGYDIYYVENMGIALDFEILLKTVRVIGKE